MEVDGGSVTITNSQIKLNGSLTIAYCGNSGGQTKFGAPGAGGRGGAGGLTVRGGTVNFIQSTISDNDGSAGGTAAPLRVILNGNTVVDTWGTMGDGGTGGVYVPGGTLGLYNSTVSGNSGGPGGTVDGTTSPNGTGSSGDGAMTVGAGGTVTMVYTTIWGNSAGPTTPMGSIGVANLGTLNATASIVQDCRGTFGDQGYNAEANSCSDPVNGPADSSVLGGVDLQGLKAGYNSTPLLPENGTARLWNYSADAVQRRLPWPIWLRASQSRRQRRSDLR